MATILIVDDDPTVREMLHDLLSEDLQCHTADRAEQALAYLEVEDYDVVITDVAMPGLSGREILSYIQANHPRTPVIVISGRPDGGGENSLMAMGAFAYITKPFKLEQMEETVTRAIARRLDMVADSQASPN